MSLAALLAHRGHSPMVYDPAGVDGARRALGDRVRYAATIGECVADADVIVVATDWRDFAALGAVLDGSARRPVVFDCWRMFKPGAVNAEIVHLGRGPDRAVVRQDSS